VFSAARNYVQSKVTRYLGNVKYNATGKSKSDSLNFETLLSYNYNIGTGFRIIPNVGVRYGKYKDGSYNEGNIGVQNLSVAATSQNLVTGIVGTKVALAALQMSESTSITPAVHGSVEHYFNNKSQKLQSKLTWAGGVHDANIDLQKLPKVGYNIGTSVLIDSKNIKVIMEYNYHLHKKYQSHQGVLKLKIVF
jgi:hypothetical protein